MSFNSLEFLLFFPVVAALFFSQSRKLRWPLLLAASYFFYMSWRPAYVFLILASTAVDYVAGLGMQAATSRMKRRSYLALSLVANLGLLFVFKYYNFFSRSFEAAFDWLGLPPEVPVLLPVGISFYTFQTLSYSIDVYRRRFPAQRHLGRFALYVAFFPQLVAGPIERPHRLLPQLARLHARIDYARITGGLKLMAWGLFKKMVIADRLAPLVDQVYADPQQQAAAALILATYCFGLQIYFDFSGYSDIAVGGARVLGVELMQNFRQPYLSCSLREFWRRWHISLSTWFRDYLYVPLGGNRLGRWRMGFNMLVVFLLSGLWHGANWTFLVWGGLHGLGVLFSHATEGLRNWTARLTGLDRSPKLRRLLGIVFTFHFITFAWIFFRAPSISSAFRIVQKLFQGGFFNLSWEALPVSQVGLLTLLVCIVLTEWIDWLKGGFVAFLSMGPSWLRWVLYSTLVVGIILFGSYDEQRFIYFQF